MGSYRLERIEELLNKKEKLSTEDMKEIQKDLVSNQAIKFLDILRPLLPKEDPVAQLLANWNCKYEVDYREPLIFEEFYSLLQKEAFSKVFKNPNALDKIITKGFGPFFYKFDDLIFDYSPNLNNLLWHNRTRDELFSVVIQKVLKGKSILNLPTYAQSRSVNMDNMLFAGKLGFIGTLLGVDYGPVQIPGSRATVCQGQLWEDGGRKLSFAPSWRFVTDISKDEVESILPGGPSGNIFSGLYFSEVERWIGMQLKKTKLM